MTGSPRSRCGRSARRTPRSTPWTTPAARSPSRSAIRTGRLPGAQLYPDHRVRGVMNAFADHDELYWNATGNGWDVPIAAAAVRVTARGTAEGCLLGRAARRGSFLPASPHHRPGRHLHPGWPRPARRADRRGRPPQGCSRSAASGAAGEAGPAAGLCVHAGFRWRFRRTAGAAGWARCAGRGPGQAARARHASSPA